MKEKGSIKVAPMNTYIIPASVIILVTGSIMIGALGYAKYFCN